MNAIQEIEIKGLFFLTWELNTYKFMFKWAPTRLLKGQGVKDIRQRCRCNSHFPKTCFFNFNHFYK